MNSTIATPMVPPVGSLVEAALAEARLGRPVFLLAPGGKSPLPGSHGYLDATTDEQAIRQMFAACPNANYGIAIPDSLLVLDADLRNFPDGRNVAAELLATYPALAQTYFVRTPRRGIHCYYQKDPALKLRVKQLLWPGIDFLSKGHYVVGPGSRTELGVYQAAQSPLPVAPLPAEFIACLERAAEAQGGEDHGSLLLLDDFRTECRYTAAAVSGQGGNNTTLALAFKGRDMGLPEQAVYESMLELFNPRCAPPWSEAELRKIVGNAFRYAKNAQGVRNPEVIFSGVPLPPPETALVTDAATEETGNNKKQSQASKLLALVSAGPAPVELWHDVDGVAFASVSHDRHIEHHPVRSRAFRSWLQHRFYQQYGGAPSAQAMEDALRTIEAKARFDGAQHQPATRLAEHDGKIYLDLCDSEWRAVEIAHDGWRVIAYAPIKFIRSSGMRPLPVPRQASSEAFERLRPMVNLPDAESWALFLGYLVACLRPTGPYPVLQIVAEQGSGKTTLVQVMRRLIDPAEPEVRSKSQSERDLLICASHSHLLCFDNLSGLSQDLSDSLCRLSTGGGNGYRKLYEDAEEVAFNLMRPVILNGIDDIGTRGDLNDRSIILSLPPIEGTNRKSQADLEQELEAVRADVIGALLSAVSGALRRLPTTKLASLPRMADFAQWVAAAEPDLSLQEGEFLAAYEANRASAARLALEVSSVGQFIATSLELPWTGTANALLTLYRLSPLADSQHWRLSPRGLGNELRRLAPVLRQNGIRIVQIKRTGTARNICIEKG